MIIVDENLIGLWFLPLDKTTDYLCALQRLEDGRFEINYRVRCYDPVDPGNDAHSGRDRKKWWRARGTGTAAEFLAKVRRIVKTLAYYCGEEASEILMGAGGPEEFCATLARQPWAHLQREEDWPEELEERP